MKKLILATPVVWVTWTAFSEPDTAGANELLAEEASLCRIVLDNWEDWLLRGISC